jgi:hypothetical protein
MIMRLRIFLGFIAGLIFGVVLAGTFPTAVHRFGHVEMVLAPGAADGWRVSACWK